MRPTVSLAPEALNSNWAICGAAGRTLASRLAGPAARKGPSAKGAVKTFA